MDPRLQKPPPAALSCVPCTSAPGPPHARVCSVYHLYSLSLAKDPLGLPPPCSPTHHRGRATWPAHVGTACCGSIPSARRAHSLLRRSDGNDGAHAAVHDRHRKFHHRRWIRTHSASQHKSQPDEQSASTTLRTSKRRAPTPTAERCRQASSALPRLPCRLSWTGGTCRAMRSVSGGWALSGTR